MTHETESDHRKNIESLGWDPLDPHKTHDSHEGDRYFTADVLHGHVIVKWQTLVVVLGALLFFTALTVAITQAEIWVSGTFGIELPHWINIAGAMSIATVKAVLVCAFFMQLRYDKALHTFAMLFCIVGVGLFLTFVIIDLNERDHIRPYKAQYEKAGGTGVGMGTTREGGFSLVIGPRPQTSGMSLAEFSFQRGITAAESEESFWAHYYDDPKHHAQHPRDENNFFKSLGYDHSPEPMSDANRSVYRSGLTQGLFDETDPNAHEDEGSHESQDDHTDDDH